MTAFNLHFTFRDGGTGDAGDPYTGLDRFGRLIETLWKQGTSDRVRSQYGRNRLGGVTWRRDEQAHSLDVDTEDNLYGYDGLQQVKERQRGDLTGTAPDYTGITSLQQQEGWTYDSTGNWAAYSDTSPTNAQTRTHNRANEITQIASAPGNVEPGYDPVGNMLTLPKELGLSAEQYDLTWDAWNRLVAVKDGGTTVATYTYDGLTRRLTNSNATETRHYYYNSAWREVEERVDGAAIAVDRQYTWGLRDRWDLLRRKRSVGGSLDEALYVLRDYLDPVAIVDGSGAVVERYAYDAFGNARILAPDYSSRTTSDYDWGFLFHSEVLDRDTSLYNYGFRYYSPTLGRWPTKDPAGEQEGLNLYVFADNNGPNAVDLLGLAPGDMIGKFSGDVEAGSAAAHYAFKKSKEAGAYRVPGSTVYQYHEFCGYICYNPKECYYAYTISRQGRLEWTDNKWVQACDVEKADKCPDGWETVATYHSHPGSPGLPGGQRPSVDDYKMSNARGRRPGYIGWSENGVTGYQGSGNGPTGGSVINPAIR